MNSGKDEKISSEHDTIDSSIKDLKKKHDKSAYTVLFFNFFLVSAWFFGRFAFAYLECHYYYASNCFCRWGYHFNGEGNGRQEIPTQGSTAIGRNAFRWQAHPANRANTKQGDGFFLFCLNWIFQYFEHGQLFAGPAYEIWLPHFHVSGCGIRHRHADVWHLHDL